MRIGLKRLIPSGGFARVVWALALGVLVGVFFGEPAGRLEIVGDAYVMLLQMTVVPYVLVSLVGGLGGLKSHHARRLGRIGGGLVLILWGLTLLALLALPLGYPDWEAGAFFSTSALESSAEFDPLLFYIPANPFFAAANTILPAVVVFSILAGLALIRVPNKAALLQSLENITQTLMQITRWVVSLTPIGIFAIAASAAGTLRIETLSRLQVYLWTYCTIWVLLTFLILPMLVARATSLSFGDVMRRARTPMITAIAAGSVLVVLPMIAERCKELLRERGIGSEDAEATVDVLVPTAYSFPSVGTLLGIGFIQFAAWYTGASLAASQYPSYLVMGMLSSFGQMAVAIPFLLDLFRLPADLFQLFLLGGVVTGRLSTGLAAMHAVVIGLLGAAALVGAVSWRRLVSVSAAGLALVFAAQAGLGLALTAAVPYEYEGADQFVAMRIQGPTAPLVGSRDTRPGALSEADRSRDRLDVIRQRGSLRVAHLPDRLPYAYVNDLGEVVGFDMELLHALARSLELDLEIVSLEPDEINAALETGVVDLIAGGLAITPVAATERAYTVPYSQHTAGFIVRDHDRGDFASLARLRRIEDLTIGVPAVRYFEGPLAAWLPNASLEPITTPRTFLAEARPEIDAILYSAEAGGAWSLIYPRFSVVVPADMEFRVPVAFAVPRGQPGWLNFVNNWIALGASTGLVDDAYARWIAGRDQGIEEPRWSIARDVLGWWQ